MSIEGNIEKDIDPAQGVMNRHLGYMEIGQVREISAEDLADLLLKLKVETKAGFDQNLSGTTEGDMGKF
ncbi:MAG: hypothetical protein Q7S11_03795 [bacterium]|nr:hypothetical protein [bacterium]